MKYQHYPKQSLIHPFTSQYSKSKACIYIYLCNVCVKFSSKQDYSAFKLYAQAVGFTTIKRRMFKFSSSLPMNWASIIRKISDIISISRNVCVVCIPSSKDSFYLKVFPKYINAGLTSHTLYQHWSCVEIIFVPCKLSSELITRLLSCLCCNLHTNNQFLASRLEFFCVWYILCHCDQVSTETLFRMCKTPSQIQSNC